MLIGLFSILLNWLNILIKKGFKVVSWSGFNNHCNVICSEPKLFSSINSQIEAINSSCVFPIMYFEFPNMKSVPSEISIGVSVVHVSLTKPLTAFSTNSV